MIRFARTFDFGAVRDLITHPRVWPFAGEDSGLAPGDFEANEDPRIWYVFAYDAGEFLGGFMFVPQTSVCWEVHLLLLPASWGLRSAEVARGVFAWMFEHSPCRRIVGATPACYRLAVRLAERAGMVRYGVNPQAFLKYGILQDVILSGISKGE
jgi:RimJ/RimL family protein N-acetyltransferase